MNNAGIFEFSDSWSERSFHALASSLPLLIWVAEADGRVVYWNDQLPAYTGRDPRVFGNRVSWDGIVHPDDLEGAQAAYREGIDTGTEIEVLYRLRRHDGVYRWFLARVVPQRDAAGRPVQWFGTATDIDERRRSEERLRFLATISRIMNVTADVKRVLQRVADHAVPAIADMCFIFVRSPQDDDVPFAIAHVDPAKRDMAEELLRIYPVRPLLRSVMLDARPLHARTISIEQLRSTAVDERHFALLQSVGFSSRVAVPLLWRGRSYGALDLFNSEGRSALDDDDVRFAEVLGERIAAALDDVRVYAREKKVSESFQQAALAPSLPRVEGLELDAVYMPAEREAEVGGDWYDAFVLDDGRVVVSVGDVAGKGLAGAVLMANVRQAIRVVALQNFSPGEILASASKALVRERPDRMVTAFVAIIDPRERSCEYASAGHPPPVLRTAGGATQFMPCRPALPLGLLEEPPPSARVAGIARGSMIVLYTDGVTEATRNLYEGEELLLASVALEATAATSRPARLICESVVAGEPKDDVAILAITFGPGSYWSFQASDAWAAQGTRVPFVRALRETGTADSDYASAELIFGELVSNVVRHAPGRVEMRLDWEGPTAVLHVIDTGAQFAAPKRLPKDLLSEGGRGLFIVAALGHDFRVQRLRAGNHVRVGLPVRRAAEHV